MNDEAQHSEMNDTTTRGMTETKSTSTASKDKMVPDLTLVLIGDKNSIEIGPNNFLLDHDEQTNVEHFSSKLYDLCGRHISVINMLGFPNIDRIPLNQGIHAFLLLLPNGQHVNHYNSAVQTLEKAFGKDFLSFVMTVVTHKLDDKCESALEDLKDFSSFDEQRFHTCIRSMTDAVEIIDLLEKIDVMVSENNHRCYSRLMCDEKKEKKEQLDHKEESAGTVEEMENTDQTKSNVLDESGEAEHSEKTDDNIGEQTEIESSAETEDKDEQMEVSNDSTAGGGGGESETRCETDNKVQMEESTADTQLDPTNSEAQHSETNDTTTREMTETKSASTASKDKTCSKPMCDGNQEQKEQLDHKLYQEESVRTVEEMENTDQTKSNVLNEPRVAEHSEKTDDNVGEQSKTETSTETEEKGKILVKDYF